ncbi:MAG: peptidoglycan DD-metalloendopeptidase family protein [Rhodospirillaceae bacterium]
MALRRRTAMLAVVFLCVLSIDARTPASAQNSAPSVTVVKAQLAAQIKTLRQALIKSAAKIQNQQVQLQAVDARLAALALVDAADQERLIGLRQSLATLGVTLQNLARRPPEAVILGPGSAIDSARAALLLESAIARVSDTGKRLRRQIDKSADTRRAILYEQEKLFQMTTAYEYEQQQLETLLGEKLALLSSSGGAAAKSQKKREALARSAKSFRGLLQKLQTDIGTQNTTRGQLTATTKADKPTRSLDRSQDGSTASAAGQGMQISSIMRHKGKLPVPAIGNVVQRFGEPERRGQRAKGIKIKTRSGAPIVAPHDGEILFADIFRGYGKILIIDHGQGYHTLLAGLGRIYSTVGQAVLAGEPVGVMNEKQGTGGQRPEVYLEMRYNGLPIDPLPWLAPQTLDANG